MDSERQAVLVRLAKEAQYSSLDRNGGVKSKYVEFYIFKQVTP